MPLASCTSLPHLCHTHTTPHRWISHILFTHAQPSPSSGLSLAVSRAGRTHKRPLAAGMTKPGMVTGLVMEVGRAGARLCNGRRAGCSDQLSASTSLCAYLLLSQNCHRVPQILYPVGYDGGDIEAPTRLSTPMECAAR